ncbi:translation factor [Mycoplasma feriruminatoris]|uniref:L-threonylcarbamoyladenylate synthase n=1 Tax=Mycoplasma feriruminatoris TaxID=1179777 RepID=UPI0002A51E2F|nr:Sua5/YciO/YrdC/YwlC family protein [Mycoplasma feriruminatoris]UKS53811.1 Threonylcarbamoyl-AMP synthase [Mycoplasma feriruminatoris]WFQ89908.1 Threonylcarbamoyl-AMP synthase [Mycoplasma feriruminatoris]WFQ90729.1 translation factor [Mycoplasma feriruminatoris]WFQ91550.1 Threonylcarbamoyl-AMP synthase [Mycoplasma feriruminatoris]WFQ95728.1 translation factor [Mycoplasma feriruminatoris]
MLTDIKINKAIELLKNNQIIILPTDTIYGLSAVYSLENQIRVNQVKNADITKPLIVLISSLDQLDNLDITDLSDKDYLLNDEPTTVIFKTKSSSMGIRLVKRDDIKKIINTVGPIISTSVNLHNNKHLTKEVDLINFNQNIEVFFDNELNNKPSKIYSSILKKYLR